MKRLCYACDRRTKKPGHVCSRCLRIARANRKIDKQDVIEFVLKQLMKGVTS